MDNRRYYGLDALRGVMMMLGIVLHGSQFYIADPPIPVPTDPHTSPLFTVIVLFIHSFRMPLFFVLAGFFTSLLVEKYGIRGSYVNRLKRIAAPLAVGMVTIVPLTGWLAISFFVSVSTGEHVLVTRLAQIEALDLSGLAEYGIRPDPSPVHLWFLYYLLWFYLTIPICRAVVAWSVRAGLEARLAAAVRSPWLMPFLGLWTAATLWPFKSAVVFEGFIYFTPHLPSLVYYGSFFVLGYAFHHYREILETFRMNLGRFALLAAVLFPAALWFSGQDLAARGGDPLLHAGATVLHGLATWALIYTFAGMFLRWFDYDSPWILYISQSSYWVYLVHMPAVSLVAWALLPMDLSAYVKFPIVAACATVMCFTSYHYAARRSWISVLLNGKRFHLDWPWRAAPPSASASPAASST
ncbi:MAG TPA: acyltransferase family protein [Pseudomonadales bacterium]|nr:acyltransferase family protein [Pseudomonadales bacterium]